MEKVHKIGRRKTATARVNLYPGTGQILINRKSFETYFKTDILRITVLEALTLLGWNEKYDIKANVRGGGTSGQAEAIRLGIARALVEIDPEVKPILKKEKLMTRDPRMVERKKFGQKKARKRFQFSKR